jgi:quinol monooxygenase YgiN
MLMIVGTIRFPPEKMAEARPAMARMISASRQETGCLGYAYAEDILEPGLIHVIESWRDEDCLTAHFVSAHLADWRAACAAFGAFDRNLRRYDADGSRPI